MAKTKKFEDARVDMHAADKARKEMLNHYTAEPKVSRSLSPLYQPYFGRVMQVSVNGITIAFPVDGSSHDIPETFADAIDARRMAIDAMLTKSHRMSQIATNVEHYPGELQMF
jgi:hypothetical protein